jgi:hypothetical protein
LAAHCHPVTFQPVAIEYVFWQERTPEVLVELGEPLRALRTCSRSKGEWQVLLEARLAEAQQALAAKAVARDPRPFDVLIDGTVGVGRVYDGLRRLRARWRGQPFDPRHGDTQQPEPPS